MNLSMDVANRVSPALSDILEAQANNPDAIQDITLGAVRATLGENGFRDMHEADRMHPDTHQSLFNELDELIEEFGEEAPVRDFILVEAGEALSTVFQSLIDTSMTPPTLGRVQEAMFDGLVARLVGEGAIDPDDDETLQDEMETLIRRFGPDVPAERFLRYE